jgi:tripeptide aminopeptidase
LEKVTGSNSQMVKGERLLNTFFNLLRIKSPSGNEKEIADFLKVQLEKLGARVWFDDAGKNFNGNCGNLFAFIPAMGKGKKENIPIFLNAHMDTVRLNGDIIPYEEDGVCRNKNCECILGGDDKVALAAILEAFAVIKENNLSTGEIYLVFTVAEEVAILGARFLDIDSIPAKYGFVFDGEGDIGTIYNQAPFHNTIKIKITGRAAHAGIEPEKGINSIKAAADAISVLRLGRIDDETTCNIGIINGGAATNIIPETTTVKGEARSLVEEKLEQVTEDINNVFIKAVKKTGASIDLAVEREYDGFKISEDSFPIVAGRKAIEKLGIKAKVVSTGGGSDINIFNSRGKSAVCFSSGMENVHSNSECVKTAELEKLASLIIELCTMDLKDE